MNYVMKVCTDEYFNFLGPLKKKKKNLRNFCIQKMSSSKRPGVSVRTVKPMMSS